LRKTAEFWKTNMESAFEPIAFQRLKRTGNRTKQFASAMSTQDL
jgi:hypothetical protein